MESSAAQIAESGPLFIFLRCSTKDAKVDMIFCSVNFGNLDKENIKSNFKWIWITESFNVSLQLDSVCLASSYH
jgi:hypothetical protein